MKYTVEIARTTKDPKILTKIIKEDPNKHIIEYETIKEDDFQDLKDLL